MVVPPLFLTVRALFGCCQRLLWPSVGCAGKAVFTYKVSLFHCLYMPETGRAKTPPVRRCGTLFRHFAEQTAALSALSARKRPNCVSISQECPQCADIIVKKLSPPHRRLPPARVWHSPAKGSRSMARFSAALCAACPKKSLCYAFLETFPFFARFFAPPRAGCFGRR